MIGTQMIGNPMNIKVPEDHLIAAEMRILFVLMAKTMRVEQESRLQAAGVEMSHLQIIMMRILNYDGGKTISELSRIIMCDPSTLVPSSEGLVRKGYLSRVRDPQDRRRVLLYVTPAAAQVIETIDSMPEDDLLLNCVRQVGLEDSQQLLSYMRRMVKSLPGGEAAYDQMHERLMAHVSCVNPSDAQPPAQPAQQSKTRE